MKTASSELSKIAQLRPDPGQQFGQPEGLGDVVVRAGIEAADHVLLGVRPGQHDDRHAPAVAPELGAEVAAVGIGQADVEQDGVVAGIGAGSFASASCALRPRRP